MAGGDFNHFPEIIAALKEGAKVGVRQAAQDITDEANSTAPYDTGFLAASGYFVASDHSTYGQAVSKAQGANDARDVLPEVDHPDSETEALVAYAATYAVYVHDGARGRPARPWLSQAAEGAGDQVAQQIADAIRHAIDGAAH